MKTRKFVPILIFVLAVLIVTSRSASATDIEMFLQAIISGDVAEVKRLIDEEVDVNARDNKRSHSPDACEEKKPGLF